MKFQIIGNLQIFRSRLLYQLLICFVVLSPSLAQADVQITGFSNFTFGSWSGTNDMVLTDDLCVHNSVDANYKVTASGSGGSFQLQDGGNSVVYEVRFKKSGGVYAQLTHGNPSSTINGADTTSATCGGSTNATLEITLTEAALSAGASGSYSATLTVLLEPA